MGPFESEAQFKQVIEKIFMLMNDHPEVGPKLYEARAPHLFEFPDMGLRFDVTYTDEAASKEGDGCGGPGTRTRSTGSR